MSKNEKGIVPMFGVVHEFEDVTFERLGLTKEEADTRAAELHSEEIPAEVIEY